MNKKILIILSILILFLMITNVSAIDKNTTKDDTIGTIDDLNTNIYGVENEIIGNSADGDILNIESDNTTLKSDKNSEILSISSTAGTYKDLNTLIKGTETGGTLVLDEDYIYTETTDDSFSNTGIVITKSIIIDGNNHIISGNNLVMAFTINANNVVLKNIKIYDTYSMNVAGSILWSGNNGQLLNSEFNNSTTDATKSMGGFIVWLGSEGIISESKFSNGKLNYQPTDIDGASAVISYAENLRIENSKFENNIGGTGAIETTAASNNNLIYGCEFIRCNSDEYGFGAVIFSRRSEAQIENCRFINNTANKGEALIFVRGVAYIKNSYFEGNIAKTLCQASTYLDNCTFVSNQVSGSILGQNTDNNANVQLASGTTINNCKFISESNEILRLCCSQKGVSLTNSIFQNCNGKAVYATNAELLTINNCSFTNMRLSSTDVGIIQITGSSTKTTINNCKFVNCNGYKNTAIYLDGNSGYGYANYNGNTFDSVTTSAGTITDRVNKRFTPYTTLYVEVGGTGTGISKNSRTNLANALSLLDYGGTIYLKAGTYTDITTQTDLVGNLIAEEKGVIIKKGSFKLYPVGASIENIEFNDCQNSFFFQTSNNKIINCTFNNVKPTNVFTIFMYNTAYGARNALFDNCQVLNSNFRYFIGDTNTIEAVSIKNLKIESNCNFQYVICAGAYVSNNYNNITIKNSEFNGFIDHTGSAMADYYQNEIISNIKIIDSTIKNILINSRNHEVCRNNKINGIYISNSIYVGSNELFSLHYNYETKNITIIDLTNTNSQNIFNLYNIGNSISDSIFKNFDTNYWLYTENQTTINNITINNVNANTMFNSIDESSFNKLNFTDITTTNCIGSLSNTVTLSNSIFSIFKGNIKINGNDVKVTNCNFTKGETISSTDKGGAIELIKGNNFIIDSCTFKENMAYDGGAVYIKKVSNSSYIFNSKFENNFATDNGGAVYIESGISYYIDTSTKATFGSSSKINGLYDANTIPLLHIVWVSSTGTGDGSYSHPTSLSKGYDSVEPYGFIYFKGEIDTITGSESFECNKPGLTFIGNKSTTINNLPFGIGEYGTGLSIYNLIFTGDSKKSAIVWNGKDGLIMNCNFNNNGGDEILYGAAIQVTGENLNIINSTFINNIAGSDEEGQGGAIYCNAQKLTINNCTFSENSVYSKGSHIYLTENANEIIINNTKFNNGKISSNSGQGSAIYILSESNVIISNSNFYNNKAINGGALNINGIISTLKITNNKFNHNIATSNGGAIAFTTNTVNNLVMNNNRYDFNNATSNGGAIYSLVKINEENSNFTNNNASNAGALYLTSTLNSLNNIILNFNNAKNGGAIYLTSNAGFTNIINCNFTKNQGSGSAFSISANNVTIDKCIFKENIGIGYGAIDTSSGSDGLIVKNSEFYNNTATGDSGALLFASTSSNMLGYNLTFINNSAKNGGACRISGNNNAIVNSTFKNNKATDKGGAIYLYTGSYITIDDCDFIENEANYGGALYISIPHTNISNCNFTKNKANENGGAIYINTDNTSILASAFYNNRANNGAAVYIVTGKSGFEIKKSEFNKNVAQDHGVVYLIGTSNLKLGENTFINNFPTEISENYYILDTSMYTASKVYVTPDGTGSGLTEDDPTTIEKGWDIIENNGMIVFLNGEYEISKTISQNYTIVGRSGVTLKRSNDKYLFIPLSQFI